MSIVTLKKPCPFCGRVQLKMFDSDAYRKWQAGAKVQDCFPDRTADDREFLVTGICPECWDRLDKCSKEDK